MGFYAYFGNSRYGEYDDDGADGKVEVVEAVLVDMVIVSLKVVGDNNVGGGNDDDVYYGDQVDQGGVVMMVETVTMVTMDE